ncbi:hypothetical protein JCGZ_15232 [Jatropha curcas]|uniref:Secreted protein n=1 Tax=Jatropha curcas TaxID=180498 RepID=A0A067K9P2_JATCU|nr:hypothetical protein JCGZ_15232 [Jatropha curcas]
MIGPLLPCLTFITVLMYGPGVVVSRTGSSSGHLRCGPMSTASIQAVRGVIPRLTPDGFLGIWRTATIPSPVLRIRTTGAVFDSLGGRGLEDLSRSWGSRAIYPVEAPAAGVLA